MLKVYVLVLDEKGNRISHYSMDHDDPVQRRRLGEGCRDVFEAGGSVVTSVNPRLVAGGGMIGYPDC